LTFATDIHRIHARAGLSSIWKRKPGYIPGFPGLAVSAAMPPIFYACFLYLN